MTFPKIPAPRCYRVMSERHSECTSKLTELDWSNWWTDGHKSGVLYLHVPRLKDKTVHRVWCRHSDKPRLQWKSGELHWLVDRPLPRGAP